MTTKGTSLIVAIFGNKFESDQKRLIPLADSMYSILLEEMIEEFFVDVFNYYSSRGWYSIPEYQHLPNTNMTRAGIEFFGKILMQYRRDRSFDIQLSGSIYGLWEAWKQYISTSLSLKFSESNSPYQDKNQPEFINFYIPKYINQLNTPFFDRAKAIYFYNPHVIEWLFQTKMPLENGKEAWIENDNHVNFANYTNKQVDEIVYLRNDFATEPHYNTHINKFIDFLLYFEKPESETLLDEFVTYEYMHERYLLMPFMYFDSMHDMGRVFLSAKRISGTLLNLRDCFKKHHLYRSTYFELLKITKQESIWKGSLFESICINLS